MSREKEIDDLKQIMSVYVQKQDYDVCVRIRDAIRELKKPEPHSQRILEEVAKFHNEWLRIANTFLKDSDEAKDVCQDMYLKLHNYDIKLDDIRYKDTINKYYIYQIIKNLCFAYLKKKSIPIYTDVIPDFIDDSISEYEAFDTILQNIYDEIETWHHYDRNLFELYMHTGLSLRDIANGSTKENVRWISATKKIHDDSVRQGAGISVSSMFNTIKKCKLILKDKFEEDFENYFNANFDKIT